MVESSSTARPRARHVSGGDGDLDLRRKEACPSPASHVSSARAALIVAAATLVLPSARRDQCERWLRRTAAGVGLAQGGLGALEVALEPSDVADRVEAVGLGRRRVVRRELSGCPLQLQLGAVPLAADGCDLGAMDPADARKAGQGLAVAILLGRLDPFARPPGNR